MEAGAGSSKAASKDAERGSDIAPTPDMKLSTTATTGATAMEMILKVYGTNVEKKGLSLTIPVMMQFEQALRVPSYVLFHLHFIARCN